MPIERPSEFLHLDECYSLLMFKAAEANAHDINKYDVSREGIGGAAEIPDAIAQLCRLV